MRPEKKYLVEEARNYITASKHIFFVNFTGVGVADASALRNDLAKAGAQFHIAKNSIIEIVAKDLGLPDISSHLSGPTGIISGGDDEAAVAKVVSNFFKDREKGASVKVGILGEKLMSKEEVDFLGSLPSLEELRAKILSLLNTPGSQIVRVIFMNVEKQGGAEKPAEEAAQA